MRLGRNSLSLHAHGTRPRYQDGCDCAPCQKANRDYGRAYAAKTRARMKAAREKAGR